MEPTALETNFARTLAALNATNEAILYAKSPKELYRQVCEAAFSSGDFLATAVFLLEPKTNMLRLVAGVGEDIARLSSIDISIVAGAPEGSGVCGQAFRDQKISVSNDFLNDVRSLAWRQGACEACVGTAAALPLTCNGRGVGVLLVTRREAGSLNDHIVSLLERMSANISYALDNFDREAARKTGEQAMQRLNRMFGAISGTNEAIVRAKSRAELFELVCEAAVLGGMFASATIAFADPGGEFLQIAATRGSNCERMKGRRCAISAAHPEGRGLTGTSFRTRAPCIMNDYLADERTAHWHSIARQDGTRSGASFPLLQNGNKAIGVLLFLSPDEGAFTDDLVELLARLAENVSFALDNFDRADEKAKTEEQKERLTRMFAALGATNEAIMRAKSRTELFELVCEAAVVGGNFTSTAIALEKPDDVFLENVASAGPDRERASNVRLSADATRPEGQGLTGTAFRTRRPCISNDYLTDFGSRAYFYDVVRDSGTRSGAALPLLKDDRAIGVLVFLSSELGAFSPELTELLQRLAENVSFALDNFARADEKAKAEEQKDRLTRMFAALSATNEAIMRAKTRAEMFDLVCEAAANGGKFTSTTISLANPDSDFLDFLIVAGPTAETTRNVKVSISADRPEGRGLSGAAFRSRHACISNDYLADPQASAFHAVIRSDGAKSGAAFPLLIRGQAVGVMLFLSAEKDTFTPEFPNSCNGWPTMCRLPLRTSTARTRKPGQTNESNTSQHMTA